MCRERHALRVDYTLGQEELLLRVLQCTRDRLCLCSVAVVAKSVGLDWDSRDLWPRSVSSSPLVKLRLSNASHEGKHFTEFVRSLTAFKPEGGCNRLVVPATSIRLQDVCQYIDATAYLVIFDQERAPLVWDKAISDPLFELKYAEGITGHLVEDEAGAYCEIHLTLAALLELVECSSYTLRDEIGCGNIEAMCHPPLQGESSANDVHMRYPKLALCCETGEKETQETIDV